MVAIEIEGGKMSKHTPEPWKIDTEWPYKTMQWRYVVSKWDSENQRMSVGGHIGEANANLIAAAPDNYECNIELAAIVRELCAAYNHPLPQASLDRSDSAIAKARGDK
jgi:hypothetical protein